MWQNPMAKTLCPKRIFVLLICSSDYYKFDDVIDSFEKLKKGEIIKKFIIVME